MEASPLQADFQIAGRVYRMFRVGGWLRERDQQCYADVHSTNYKTSLPGRMYPSLQSGHSSYGGDELLPDRSCEWLHRSAFRPGTMKLVNNLCLGKPKGGTLLLLFNYFATVSIYPLNTGL